ncbi:MAG: tetratricopeptide repeat protein [Anaerolineaceae bacterium]|nr:tetratricopeptide repeat protein [Anaerolineaceae bacterium]MBN2677150.1 tetratricopeptide repeat protein [Anaerolineaceae bacterium]
MQLSGREPSFRKSAPKSNPNRIMIWIVLIVMGLVLIRSLNTGDVQPLFLPTPTPTRTSFSYAFEGETHFMAGDLDKAIAAYQLATLTDPDNPQLWAELARIQTYSSNLLTTDAEKLTRLQDALANIDRAEELAPEDSTVHAIRSFVLDWNASLAGADAGAMLSEAEQEAVYAIQLDPANTLALAYYAEVLVDQQKWLQAQQYARQAAEQNPNLMDVRRINAYVLESLGDYNSAIQEYEAAVSINPNLTFLYISIGKIYRHVELYDQALEYFAKAANINEQLGVNDPIPYLAIANTYVQDGQHLIAARNVLKALRINPSSPDVYAQLGLVYYKGRNYEGSIPALQCGLLGCPVEQSCEVRECDPDTDPEVVVQGMPLSDNTVVYYFTYGSVLAGLHEEGDDYCVRAMDVLGQVKALYSGDATIMGIVNAGEEICSE